MVKPLSGLDGAFLGLETPATPMHVGSLHLFQPPPRYRRNFLAAVRQMIGSRLDIAPIFRRRLVQMPLQFANPVWVDDAVDLDVHICAVDVPAPGGWLQLQACVADLHAELLDRNRPLWMIYVFEGLQDGLKAYYVKIHHAVLDGQAGAALAGALFDTSPQPPPIKAGMPVAPHRSRTPGAFALASKALRHDATQYVKLVRQLPKVLGTLAEIVRNRNTADGKSKHRLSTELKQNVAFGPRTAFNTTITSPRGFAAASVPFAEIKGIAAAQQATVNDVVLALCSGMLRLYLARHGGIPRKPLIATMPISLREAGNQDFTTQATLSLVNLATHIADPLQRLQAVRAAASATKTVAKRAKSFIPTDFPTIGGPWVIGALASLYGRSRIASALPPIANVIISNVHGPAVPLYVAGAKMVGYWPLSIVEHGVGLNITLMSYADILGVGFTVAQCAVPDPQELVTDFHAALAELQRHALPSEKIRRKTTTENAP
jgi:WS/DGAT/MGAT family acyltransferase